MIICNKCFASEQIQNTIEAYGKIEKWTTGKCPTCKSIGVYLFNTESASEAIPELSEWLSDLISCFQTEENLPGDFPKKHLGMLKTELKKNWNLFADNVDDGDVYEIITSICSDLYEFRPELFDKPVGLGFQADTSSLKEHSLICEKTWDDFVHEITNVNRYHARTINLEVFERILSHLRVTIPKETEYYRCRLTDDEVPLNPTQMGPPPHGKASPGRANAAGISCLYLANDIRTTIAEVRAGVFDNATVGTFRLKHDIQVVDLRKINKLCPVGIGMNYADYALNRKHLERIDSEMARGLKRGDHSIDYVATQYITDFVKSVQVLDEKGEYQNAYYGIIYNSTLNPGGYNLAIFYADVFECVSTQLYCVKSLAYGTDPRIE